MTLKDPFLEGTFWDKFWRPIRSRALLFTPDKSLRKQFLHASCLISRKEGGQLARTAPKIV